MLAAQALGGRVVDAASGRPVAGTPVVLLRAAPRDISAQADTTPLASGVTAPDGTFVLTAPGPGSYRARIGDGFLTAAVTLASADSADMREYRLAAPRPSGCGRVSSGSKRDPVVRAPALLDSITRTGEALCDFQVDKRATVLSFGRPVPRYPADVTAEPDGHVLMQVVVDTTGRADMQTFRAVEASNTAFVPPVRDAVRDTRFTPAEAGGRRVRQLVQMPFDFRRTRE